MCKADETAARSREALKKILPYVRDMAELVHRECLANADNPHQGCVITASKIGVSSEDLRMGWDNLADLLESSEYGYKCTLAISGWEF